MRMTNQLMKFMNNYDYQTNMKALYKLNNQMSTGLKIQNSFEDSSVYNDGMRLDYEVATLEQVQTATSKAQHFSKNTDKALGEFKQQLEAFKTKLVQGANEIHSKTSREAIANDLQGIKNHLVNIANTSINGQFLFSGSAINTKPINGETNEYYGNAQAMKTVGGAQVNLTYNQNGQELFLGKDGDYNKKVTSNTMLKAQNLDDRNKTVYIDSEHKMRDLIGFKYVKDEKTLTNQDFTGTGVRRFQDTTFFLQGKKPNGTSFTSKFKMTSDASINDLLEKIGTEYGNTPTNKVVEVTINNQGQINVKDLSKGNQVIDFHMVAATKKVANAGALAGGIAGASSAFDTVDSLTSGANSLEAMVRANPDDYEITEFVKSKYEDLGGAVTNAYDYDKINFKQEGRNLIGTVSQVERGSGKFADDNTTLSQVVASKELYPGERDKYDINDQALKMQIKSKSGGDYKVDVLFGTAVPPATSGNARVNITRPDGTTYTTEVWDSFYNDTTNPPTTEGRTTQSKNMTFRQLNDIIGMVASDSVPTGAGGNTQADYVAYKQAIANSQGSVEANMDHKGRIKVTDKQNAVTPIKVGIYDEANSDQFYGDSTGTTPATTQGDGSLWSFSANNGVEIDSPSVDIFDDLDRMIEAVRSGQYRADSEGEHPRNSGIQGAIERIDHIADHVSKIHTKVGAQSAALADTNTRASIMEVNVKTVKADITNADYGETYMNLMQKMMSYQAMLQSVAKINQLSLLNYM
ncbi:flagellin [Campylobacter showae]|uniref:Lagellar hook-associated protein FlgL n=1 Tax=Campylobacter showae CC57C TaxID=1073353 RepID=M3I3L1_9BACT|nr:flagellin [Campylobacter showae]EMG31204.1 lagellar hook-associated protein FlgL [Campylobacter showae CC57C]